MHVATTTVCQAFIYSEQIFCVSIYLVSGYMKNGLSDEDPTYQNYIYNYIYKDDRSNLFLTR